MFRIHDIFEEGGVLSKNNPHYRKRPSQVEAAAQIEFALRNRQHFILEGPCGFGKSISYLTPAIKNLIENNYKGQIVIVTSNISLQDQLFNKDIPYILDIMDELYPKRNVKKSIRPALLKGINNFLCIDKMESNDFLNNIDLLNNPQMLEVQNFYKTTEDGDLTKANFILASENKQKVTCTTSSECKSDLCSRNSECYYNKQKSKAKASKLVITNYHMLFSCKSVYSSLFDDASVIIFDEVHEAESILRDFMANTISAGTVEYIERKITEIKNVVGPKYASLMSFDVDRLKESSDRFFTDIQLMYGEKLLFSPQLITRQTDLPDPDDFTINLSKVINTLKKLKSVIEETISTITGLDAVQDIEDSVDDVSDEEDNEISNELDRLVNSMNNILVTIKSLQMTCTNVISMIIDVDNTLSDQNLVMYVENVKNKVAIGVKNVNVSNEFKRYFLDDEYVSCILTSATISVNDSFAYIKSKLGLDKVDDRVMEYMGTSPFDLKNQELWYIPEDAIPGNRREFDAKVPGQVREIIEAINGGALCLFTSNKNLKNCKEQLVGSMEDYNILVQGDRSKMSLLDEFKNDINSSLLATKSFFTGVDVPGQSLRCVIIDKLPFASPSDPVQQKLSAEHNYFGNYVLPEMIIALKQAVGRGVRSINDKCIICILDERIMSANYSGSILGSFNYEKMATRNLPALPYFLSLPNK